MITDANEVPHGSTLESDICIIGAGAAGITIAREFVDTRHKVILLESGGLEYDDNTADLYKGAISGSYYHSLDVCRLRFFGGTTNHWEGWCRPIDDFEFEQRPWLPYSGWPLTRAELNPFYIRAHQICQLGPFDYSERFVEEQTGTTRLLPLSTRFQTAAYQISPPTRFGEVYRDTLRKAANVVVTLRGNAVNIETRSPGTVDRVRVATLSERSFWVTARVFVLAAGGIENPRLLLASDHSEPAGLGNANDLVGRFFMDHPEPQAGFLLPADPLDARWAKYIWDFPGRPPLEPPAIFTPRRSMLEQEKIVTCNIAFNLPSRTEAKGWTALRRLFHGKSQEIAGDVWQVMSDLDGVVATAFGRMSQTAAPAASMLQIYVWGQQSPNPESRVLLGPERDALGMQRAQLHFQLSETDRRSMRRTVELLGQELGGAALGRIQLKLDDELRTFGNHHMGTTRMSDDPKRGVVDAQCRVHSLNNLYVAGSSVFATSGAVNPTLTIVALAVRLADHLKTLSP